MGESEGDMKALQQISLYILLFSIIFDPTNSHFGIKTLSFLFFCMINIQKVNGRYVMIPITLLCVYFVSYVHGMIIGTNMERGIGSWYLSSFMFLVILLFVVKQNLKFLKALYYLSLLFSIYILFLAAFSFLNTPFRDLVVNHIVNNDDFIMFGFREALGIPYFCLYYRTSSICVIPESVALLLFVKTRRKRYLIHFFCFALELFFSGARANMVSSLIIVVAFVIAYMLYNKKMILTFIATSLVFATIVFVVLLKLVTEQESSNLVKMGHAASFIQLFLENPLRFSVIGSGPGTIMYTVGTNSFQALTELSYFELIKCFGFIGTLVIIFLTTIPLFFIWKSKNKKIVKIALSVSYVCFYFIAGTNPLFIGSTGFTTIICMFYVCNKNVYSEFNIPLHSAGRKRKAFLPLCLVRGNI